MSGFDVMRQSQAQASQASQFYDAQRYESMRQTGGAIQDLGRMSVEIGMQKTEQAMRVAEFEQQFQMNNLKLQAMAQMDQVDMFREQVTAAKLQNEAMRMENQQRGDLFKSQQKESTEQTRARLISAFGGAEGLLAFGYDENFQSIKDEGELNKRIERAKSLRGGRGNETTEFNSERNYIMQMYRMAEDSMDEDGMEYWRQRGEALDTRRGQGGGAPRRQPEPPKLSAEDQKMVKEIAGRIIPPNQSQYSNPMSGAGMGQQEMLAGAAGLGESREQIAGFLWSNREILREVQQRAYDSDPERKGMTATYESAIQEILDSLNSPNHPRRARNIAALRKAGVLK